MASMKKNIFFILILILYAYDSIHCLSLIDGINRSAFNIITINRNYTESVDPGEPLLPNEIWALFKNIDNMLGGKCFTNGIMLHRANNIIFGNMFMVASKFKPNEHMNEYYSLQYLKVQKDPQQRNKIHLTKMFPLLAEVRPMNSIKTLAFDAKFALDLKKEICGIFIENNNTNLLQKMTPVIENISLHDKPILLIFQESAFAQTHLLNDDHVNLIIDLCKQLTIIYKNLNIHVNFSHQFNKNEYPYWISSQVYCKIINSDKKDIETCVANYSLIISEGKITYVYIKTEHDDLLKGTPDFALLENEKYELIYGNLQSQDLSGYNFSQVIVTRICADMNIMLPNFERNKSPIFCLQGKPWLIVPFTNNPALFIIQSSVFPLEAIKKTLNEFILGNEEFNSIVTLEIKEKLFFPHIITVHCDLQNGGNVFKIIREGDSEVKFYAAACNIEKNVDANCSFREFIEAENNKLFRVKIWISPNSFDMPL
jgi:hypothetical protein